MLETNMKYLLTMAACFFTYGIMDNIIIDDTILYEGTKTLSGYDFETDVDVNILGHIFEHSLTEIEELQLELEGKAKEKNKTKRKKKTCFIRHVTLPNTLLKIL